MAQLQPLASSSAAMSSSIVSRKLAALGYEVGEGALSASSLPLVGALLSDLLHTTEAYSEAKARDGEVARGVAEWSEQRDVLKKENIKLVRENNRLHRQLVEDRERRDISDREDGRRVRDAQEELAKLALWKEQQAVRQTELEGENASLKEKIDELISRASRTASLGGESVKLDVEPAKIVVSGPLVGDDSLDAGENDAARAQASARFGSPKLTENAEAVVRRANERATAAEALARSLQAEVKSLHEAIEVAASSLELREKEIERLSTIVELEGESIDKLAAEHKSEVNERLVTSLNQQVDFLTEQLANAQEAAHYRFQLEEKLGKTEKGLTAAETEVKELRTKLVRYDEDRRTRERENVDDPKTKRIETLETELKASQDAQADAATQATQLVAQREGAILQYQQAEAKLIEVEANMRHTNDALEAQGAAIERVTAERDAALQARDAFKEAAERAASSSKVTADELRVVQERIGVAERNVKESHESVQRSRAESSQAIIIARDANEKRVQAESAARTAKVENELLQQQLGVLKSELAEARETLESETQHKAVADAELSQLRGEINVVKKEKIALEDELRTTMAKLAEQTANAASASLSEEKIAMMLKQIENYQDKLSDLNEQVGGHAAKTATAEAQASKFEVAAQRATEKQEHLEQLLEVITAERDSLQGRYIELEFESKTATSRVEELEQTKGSENEARETMLNELSTLRDTARNLEMKVSRANSEASEAQRRATFLESEMTRVSDENSVLASRLKLLNESSDAAHVAELNATSDTASAREELRTTIAAREAARKEAAEAGMRAVNAERRAAESEMRADTLAQEVAERSRDVHRLKSLISSLDGTREELVARIEALSSEAKVSKQQLGEANEALDAAAREAQKAHEQCKQLTTSLGASDAECDRLQAELDSQSEQIAAGKSTLDSEKADSDSVRQALAAAETRAERSDRALEEAHASSALLAGEMDTLKNEILRLRAEQRGRSEELHALSDDLSSMTREQQIVNAELLREKNEKERLSSELARYAEAATAAAARHRVKETEMEELIVAYQELGTENRRLDHCVVNVERELQEAQATLRHREASIESVRKQVREVEDENRRYVIDLQAFERQVDSLTRQLAAADQRQNTLSDGKVSAMANLGNAQQVIMELERARENLQRELAAVSARLDSSNDRMTATTQEKELVIAQLRAEKSRSTGLEELVGKLRMRDHIVGQVSDGIGGVSDAASEKMELERKLVHLQALLQDREAELERMRSRVVAEPSGAPTDSADANVANLAGAPASASTSSSTDKEHLLQLLGKMDRERADLQMENADLLRQIDALRASIGGGGGGGHVSAYVEEHLESALDKAHLEAALEKAQREFDDDDDDDDDDDLRSSTTPSMR